MLHQPKGKLYRHINWPLIVRIDNNWVITEIVTSPPEEDLIKMVLSYHIDQQQLYEMIRDSRVLTEEERVYFREMI